MRFKNFISLGLAFGINLGCDSNSSSRPTPDPTVETDSPVTGTSLPGPATTPVTTPIETPTPDDGNPPAEPLPVGAPLIDGLRITQAGLFRNVGDGVARKTDDFVGATSKLRQAIEQFCSNPVENDRTPVRQAWKEAMLLWEQLELMQIGPIAANAKLLKSNIYGWPQATNACRIDEEALKANKNASYTLPASANRKGLQAIEYLLFEESLASSCPANSNSGKEWNALSAASRSQARCSYLKPVAAELQGLASSVAQAWGPEGKNYLTSVIGNPNAEKVALQSLYENLFYLDIEVKNLKIASAAGHDAKYCLNSPAPCPGKDEFPLSQISLEAIRANILAFTDLIYGFEDVNQQRPGGFAALVREVGNDGVAKKSEDITRRLSVYATSQNDSLATLIAKQNQENCEESEISMLCKLRKSIKEISVDLKKEYSRILSLTVPASPQGDND